MWSAKYKILDSKKRRLCYLNWQKTVGRKISQPIALGAIIYNTAKSQICIVFVESYICFV